MSSAGAVWADLYHHQVRYRLFNVRGNGVVHPTIFVQQQKYSSHIHQANEMRVSWTGQKSTVWMYSFPCCQFPATFKK